jgi:mycothiol synthase
MTIWRQTQKLSGPERLEVLQLLNEMEGRLKRAPIDESARRMVLHDRPASYWLQGPEGHIQGFAVVTGTDPGAGEMAGGSLDRDLLELVLASHPHLHWWTRGELPVVQGIPIRTLLMMGMQLDNEFPDRSAGLTIRPFDPQTDFDRWLSLNKLAFMNHPEQGAWNPQDLSERLNEPWFDPSGFLVVMDDTEMVASVWTKIHELHPAREGEIYVLWVAPEQQGKGLGAIATAAGLRNLQLKGASRAVLFVEESNTSARALYSSFGFKIEREDHLMLFER